MRPQLLTRVRAIGALALLGLLFAGVSCTSFDDRAGSSGGAEGPTVTAAGTWSGAWAITSGVPDAGTVRFVISEDEDGTLFGTSEWTGSPCWTDPGLQVAQPPITDPALAVQMQFSGTLAGNLIAGASVVNIPRDPSTVTPRRAAYRASGRLEIIDDRMVGTFSVTEPRQVSDSIGFNTSRCNDLIHRLGNSGVLELTRE